MSYPTIYVKPTIDTKGLCSVVNHCLTELQMYDQGLINDEPVTVPSLRTRGQLLCAIQRKYIMTKKWMSDPENVRLWNNWDFHVAEQALDRIEKYLLTGKIDPVTEEA